MSFTRIDDKIFYNLTGTYVVYICTIQEYQKMSDVELEEVIEQKVNEVIGLKPNQTVH